MSSDREKPKVAKRPFIGDDDVSRKKKRTEISGCTSPQKDHIKKGGKNLAANRLAELRTNFKKESQSVYNGEDDRKALDKSSITENSRNRNLHVDSNISSTTTLHSAKSKNLDVSTKKNSVNDRFKKALQRSQNKSDDLDDIITVIDDSPGPVSSTAQRSYDQISSLKEVTCDQPRPVRNLRDASLDPASSKLSYGERLIKKAKRRIKNREDQINSSSRVANDSFRLSRFVINNTSSPISNRLICDQQLENTEASTESSPRKAIRLSRPVLHDSASSPLPRELVGDEHLKDSEPVTKNRFDRGISPRKAINYSIRVSTHVIDNSPSSVSNRLGHDQQLKSSTNTLSPRKSINDSIRLSKSFVVVSEASDSEESGASKTPANDRLKKLREICRSSSGPKRLTPDSPDKTGSSAVTVRENVRSSGLRIPLNRSIFKSPRPSLDKSFEDNSKGIEQTRIVFEKPSDTSENDKLSIEDVSPSKSIFRAKIYQNSKSPNKSDKRVGNIFRCKGISLADRIASIKNQVTGAAVKQISITMDCIADPPLPPNTEMSFETDNPKLVCPSIPRSVMVENWIDNRVPQLSASKENLSDSMLVNVNDSLFNKTELMTDPQEDNSMEWDSIPEPLDIKKPSEVGSAIVDVQKEKVTCVVTDTNVFLHSLARLKDLLNVNIMGGQRLKIYIPWMVLQELDHFKDNSPKSTKSLIVTAQRFINKHLAEPDPRIIGQSVSDVCQQLDLGKCPDDKILACCLQAKAKFDTVILLSNDVNLCNKALTNDVKAYNPREILAKLRSGKYHKIKVRLQTLLSQIIVQTSKRAFGDTWSQMDMLQDCPWSFEGCLKRFKRYWSTVFSELLLKQCRKTIDELISLSDRGDIMDTDTQELKQFINKVKEFLFYLQDIDQFNISVKRIREEIDRIVQESSAL